MGLHQVQVTICRLSVSCDRPSRVIVKPFTGLSPPPTRWFIVITLMSTWLMARPHPMADTHTSSCAYVRVRVLGIILNSDDSDYYDELSKFFAFGLKSKSKTQQRCTKGSLVLQISIFLKPLSTNHVSFKFADYFLESGAIFLYSKSLNVPDGQRSLFISFC